MTEKLRFTKMHGIGNDYIFIDYHQPLPVPAPVLARRLSRHRFSVGSDGIILIGKSDQADCSMAIFNADGSEAEMCGNGLRCVAKYVHDRHFVSGKLVTIETKAGIMKATISESAADISSVAVSLPEPRFSPEDIPVKAARSCFLEPFTNYSHTEEFPKDLTFTTVNVGNPHCVIVLDEELDDYPVRDLGPKIENLSIFPEKTNVEFLRILTPEKIRVRVWERGSGETMACGSGACAAVAACCINNLTSNHCLVKLEGGELSVTWKRKKGFILEGPAEEVFEGEIPFNFLEQSS